MQNGGGCKERDREESQGKEQEALCLDNTFCIRNYNMRIKNSLL